MSELRSMKTREKLLFAWGDFYGGGAQSIISVLYFVFLINILRINPVWAGAIITISKVWDAISDPLMGVISDNTRTKIGRRRPYILLGGLLVVFAFALMWFPIGDDYSHTFKLLFVLFSYLFYNTVATIIAVPYSSLSAEISVIEKERNNVNVIRLVFSTIASAVCTLIPSEVLTAYNSGSISLQTFYIIIGIGFGIFFAIPLILIGFFTKERATIPTEKSQFDVKNFIKPLKVKAYRQLVYMYLAQSISMDILGNGIVLYALYCVRGSSTIFLGTFIGIQLLLFPLINKLINVTDKRKIYYFGLPLAIVAMIGLGIYPNDWPVMGAYIVTGFVALGFAGAQLITWIIFPDAVDVGELKFGHRITGSFSGIMTFTRKMSSAFAIFIFGMILQLTHYEKPPLGVTSVPQPNSAILGIRIAMTGTFIVLMIFGYISARRFVLTNSKSKQVSKYLNRLRDGQINNLSIEEKQEYELLQKDLF